MPTWEDTGRGYFSSTDLTREFLAATQPECPLAQFVKPLETVGGVGGDTVMFPKIYDLEGDIDTSSLSEDADIDSTSFGKNKGLLICRDYGKSVNMSEKLEKSAAYDMHDAGLKALKNHMRRKVNRLIAAQLRSTYYKFASNSDPASRWDTDGTLSVTANQAITGNDILEIRDYAADTLKAEKWGNGAGPYDYIFVSNQGTFTQIKRNIAAVAGATDVTADLRSGYQGAGDSFPLISGRRLPYGAQGLWERVLFVVDNDTLATVQGTTAFKGEGFFLAAWPVLSKTITAPEIRQETKWFGRKRRIAWYGYFGYALARGNDTADVSNNQGVCVHVTST